MARIKFDEPRHMFSRTFWVLVSAVVAITATILPWPTPYKHEPIRVIAIPRAPTSTLGETNLAPNEGRQGSTPAIDRSQEIVETPYSRASQSTDEKPAPRHGAEANDEIVQPCLIFAARHDIDVDIKTIQRLIQANRETAIACRVGESVAWLLHREQQIPSAEDILETGNLFIEFEMRRIIEGGNWTTSDYERLASERLTENTTLILYLVLKERNSRFAEKLRRDPRAVGIEIERYLMSGMCPKFKRGAYCHLDREEPSS